MLTLRFFDPVVVKSKDTPFLGKEIKKLGVFAVKNGQLQPIPFQVDEMRKGRYLERGDGVLSEEDEIVFLAKDMGERLKGEIPDADRTMCVKADDLYAYLVLFDRIAPRADKSYMKFKKEPKREIYESPWYKVIYEEGYPYMRKIIFKKPEGESEIIDGITLGFYSKILGFGVRKKESDIIVDVKFVKEGPVRILRVVNASMKVIWKLRSPSTENVVMFYPSFVVIPSRLELPFDPRYVTSKSYSTALINFKVKKGKLVTKSGRLEIDGKMDDTEKAFKDPMHWWAYVQGEGSKWKYFYAIRGQKTDVKTSLLYSDTPEGVKAGVKLENLERLKKGTYVFEMLGFILPPEVEIKDVMKYLEVPLKVKNCS